MHPQHLHYTLFQQPLLVCISTNQRNWQSEIISKYQDQFHKQLLEPCLGQICHPCTQPFNNFPEKENSIANFWQNFCCMKWKLPRYSRLDLSYFIPTNFLFLKRDSSNFRVHIISILPLSTKQENCLYHTFQGNQNWLQLKFGQQYLHWHQL